jgi:hypothetical protein
MMNGMKRIQNTERGTEWRAVKRQAECAKVLTALLGAAPARSGRRLLWRCPFHEDHKPSLQVDPQWNRWKCWPCDLGGNAVDFVMKLSNLDFLAAVRQIADLLGIAAGPPVRHAHSQSERSPVPEVIRGPTGIPAADAQELVAAAERRLWSPHGQADLDHLRGRGLDDATIRAARLGSCQSVRVPKQDGSGSYPACGIVVPWFDSSGEGLSCVIIRQPAGFKPRYAEAFRDRPDIYPGAHAIQIGQPVIIVEGELDTLLLAQQLPEAAVVTFGAAGNNKPAAQYLELLAVATQWFIALDGDAAGDKAAALWPHRAIRVRPPDGIKDWTELHQCGFSCVRYHWGRYLPLSRSIVFDGLSFPRDLASNGDLTKPADDGPDPYAAAEREAIQQEH